ncbi:hypothetical protein D9M70_578930 [compost metagenome]
MQCAHAWQDASMAVASRWAADCRASAMKAYDHERFRSAACQSIHWSTPARSLGPAGYRCWPPYWDAR